MLHQCVATPSQIKPISFIHHCCSTTQNSTAPATDRRGEKACQSKDHAFSTEKDQKPLPDHQPQPKTLAFVIMADKGRSNTVNPLHIEGDTSGAGAGSGARGRRAMSASAANPAAAVPRRRAPTVTFKGSLVRYAPETRAAPSELQEGPPPSKFSILCGVGEIKGPSLYRACISYVVSDSSSWCWLHACRRTHAAACC